MAVANMALILTLPTLPGAWCPLSILGPVGICRRLEQVSASSGLLPSVHATAAISTWSFSVGHWSPRRGTRIPLGRRLTLELQATIVNARGHELNLVSSSHSAMAVHDGWLLARACILLLMALPYLLDRSTRLMA